MKLPKDEICATCRRERETTFHHLIPKKMHRKRVVQEQFSKEELMHTGIWVCRDCHKEIHRIFSHQELAETYNSLQALLNHDRFNSFLNWVKKQSKSVKS